MRIRKKKWVQPYLEQETKYLLKENLKGQFKEKYNAEQLILEVGMGMGDFLTALAATNPNNLYIGLEKDETCVAKAIMKAHELGLENLIIIKANAQDIKEIFAEGEVDMMYLQFSDPWPKKGHFKRRLTYKTFLENYDYILKTKGQIFFKTDNQSLYCFSLPSMTSYGFKMLEMSLNYHADEIHYPLTGYEAKFIELGMPIYYALFEKE